MHIYIHRPICRYGHIRGAYDETLENSIRYCYTSSEMTDQFLLFQVQIKCYCGNWNTPY